MLQSGKVLISPYFSSPYYDCIINSNNLSDKNQTQDSLGFYDFTLVVLE